MKRKTEYREEPCCYCGHKTLKEHKCKQGCQLKHINKPKTFKYLECDTCKRTCIRPEWDTQTKKTDT